MRSKRTAIVLAALFAPCAGCYRSHEAEPTRPCAGAIGEELLFDAESGEFAIPLATDGCDRIAAAFISPEPPLRRLHVVSSRDGGRSFETIFAESIASLSFWDLALDARGEEVLVTREEDRLWLRRSEGEGFGEPIALSAAGARVGIGGDGGTWHPSEHVHQAAGAVVFTFWTWPIEGLQDVFVARIDEDVTVRPLGARGHTSRVCQSGDERVIVSWVAAEEDRAFLGVAPSIEGELEITEVEGWRAGPVSVECSQGLAAWASPDGIELFRYAEHSGWARAAQIESRDARYPTLWTAHDRVVLNYREVDDDSRSASFFGDTLVSDEPGLGRLSYAIYAACSGAIRDSFLVMSTEVELDLRLVRFDHSDSGGVPNASLGVPSGLHRPYLRCAGEREIVTFWRDRRPWIAQVALGL